MFNDKCELTKAVLDGNKTMTRRDAKLFNKNTMEMWDKELSEEFKKKCIDQLTKYKVGEIVAIAQCYCDCGSLFFPKDEYGDMAGYTNKKKSDNVKKSSE